ncbi:hypothetical protein [Persicobacter psychrovividus]|uniref:Uncharacterized protein n=1 Tax=Persicobacter psychrovividus TaxID=387638 RepID=A0ABM7VFL1_9BACT|nr:hypothetical protein PEPS_20190 [Persicobacter psychrovividus]
MDKEKLNEALIALALKRNELTAMSYSDDKYDDVEEELHDLEDDFIDEYGEYLEDIIGDIHDQYCPESDVLSPIAYVAHEYTIVGKDDDGKPMFDVGMKEGVIVDVEELEDRICRLVVIPNPLRFMIQSGKVMRKEVWFGEKVL